MADLPLHLFPLQQADGRFLLGLPAAEAGGVLVMSVGGKTVRSQRNTELPCGRILDGDHRKPEVGINLNIHCVNYLYYILFSKTRINIQKFV